MGNHTENHLSYYISIATDARDYLGEIRSWKHLKIGMEEKTMWVKDFTREEIESATVRSIPAIDRYYEKDGFLFKLGSRLPSMQLPSPLWSTIERGMPLELPKENFNYFGIKGKADIGLVASEKEREAVALSVPISRLTDYINTASRVRLEPIRWVMEGDRAILLGKPFLPLDGDTFWRLGNFLLPTGYTFNFEHMADEIDFAINPGGNYVVWETGKAPFIIGKEQFRPLSISSFRLSLKNI